MKKMNNGLLSLSINMGPIDNLIKLTSIQDLMATSSRHHHFQVIIALSILFNLHCCWNCVTFAADTTTNVYIVYMGEKQHNNPATIVMSHHEMLAKLLGSKEAAKNSILYSYKHGFSGFAASLTDSQAKVIADFPGVVRVFPNRIHKVHTTRSWDFLELNQSSKSKHNLLTEANMGDGTIIGIIDSGIWPESQSFKDDGMGPIPSSWKGICQTGQSFTSAKCNKKIIGARWIKKGYEKMYGPINTTGHSEYLSPRDKEGHGTHCASIAAGRFVPNASYLGLGTGIARGGAPLARLAIYKVVWLGESTDADELKAFDMAIHDGVDILSVSLARNVDHAGLPLQAYFDDGIAVGSFHAVAKGITVVCAAGNDGPFSDTVGNTAPWIITVAATTIDRDFQTEVTLGNDQTSLGHTLSVGGLGETRQKHKPPSPPPPPKLKTPLSPPSELKTSTPAAIVAGQGDDASACKEGSLNPTLVKGKVVHCFLQPSASQQEVTNATKTVQKAGGIGIIYTQDHNDVLNRCNITCIKVNFETGTNIISYIRGTSSATVQNSKPQTVVGKKTSPLVASFSSRGPNTLLPDVLKPDIAAPGVTILAAYPPPITGHPFEFLSGTSMACPHVAGVAALIKTLHKNWSPAAIKSAIMTTASQNGTDGQVIWAQGGNLKPATPFDMGGGHIDPKKVAHPGLIYDISIKSYIDFFCSKGYTNEQMTNMTKRNDSCSRKRRASSWDLNLPSISIPYLENIVTVTRTVTNVGTINSVYKALVQSPPGIQVKVKPRRLSFNQSTSVLSFKVTFNSTQNVQLMDYVFGSLTWTDKKHVVRIPLAVRVAHQYTSSRK
ncbi:subtilisin-like protease SBT3.3 isoform X2 [Macadamia integrifolia]|uniref:subtilisin-like protease SBT3.3 isoform X2 n=1 Tax=Macadamia integrifolia TaxID=60698 RepID=UPI001C4E5EED|nr:subtilisin-like protease SBT3.3 isoform X2 [Macadamia integrifolia]